MTDVFLDQTKICHTKIKMVSRKSRTNLIGRVGGEIKLLYMFTESNFVTTVLANLLSVFGFWCASPSAPDGSGGVPAVVVVITRAVLFSVLHSLMFDLSNNYVGVVEDRINKPHRPIVSGLVTAQGTLVRIVITHLLYSVYAWYQGIWLWATILQVVLILYSHAQWNHHWFTQDLITFSGAVAGTVCCMRLSGYMLALTTFGALTFSPWPLLIGFIWLSLVGIAEFRDMEGDKLAGRKSFPLVYGQDVAKIRAVVGILCCPVAIHCSVLSAWKQPWAFLLVGCYPLTLLPALLPHFFIDSLPSLRSAPRNVDYKRLWKKASYYFCIVALAPALAR